jgi:DNA-binding GntR family transcriptional regulator
LDPRTPPIDRVIVDAILSGSIRAGTRLGEQALATLFEVSRTSVREALIRLETRGILQVGPRRGWFVIEPSLEEAQEAFQARRAVELGILHTGAADGPTDAEKLRKHIRTSAMPSGRAMLVRAATFWATSMSAWRKRAAIVSSPTYCAI